MTGGVARGFNESETIDASMDFVVEKEAEGVEMDYSSLRREAGVMLEVFGVEPNLNLGLAREAIR